MSAIFVFLSADPVFNPEYDATIDTRFLKETERVSERAMIWRKQFDNQYLTIRLGADRIKNKRADRDIAGFDRSLLIHAEN